jgi:hypothetical protein
MNQANSTITITKHTGESVVFDPGKLKKALFQSNNALKKRALAIIHNDTVVDNDTGKSKHPDQ